MNLSLRFGKSVSKEIISLDKQLAEAVRENDQDKLASVTRLITQLIQKDPYDPSVLSVAGMVSLFRGNAIASRMQLSMASVLDPEGHDQQELVRFISSQIKEKEAQRDWMELGKKGRVQMLQSSLQKAQERFKQKKYVEADRAICEYLALESPFDMMKMGLENLGEASEQDQQHIQDVAAAEVAKLGTWMQTNEGWNTSEDLDAIQCELLAVLEREFQAKDDGVFADFRMGNASLIKKLKQTASLRDQRWAFYGYEPVSTLFEKIRNNQSGNRFHCVSLTELVQQRDRLPNHIDLALFPQVSRGYSESTLTSLFAILSHRCRKLIIVDEILNFDGRSPVIRQGAIQHRYRYLLESRGYEIESVNLLNNPSQRANGYIVASNPKKN